MGPPPFSDGNPGRPRVLVDMESPSMGPPPFSDGNAPSGSITRASFATFNGATAFQRWKLACCWPTLPAGRCSFNGATAFQRWKPERCRYRVAVLADLQWGHRLSAMETAAVAFDRNVQWCLQWGHRLSAMETSHSNCAMWCLLSLQWGHRLSAMETLRGQLNGVDEFVPSMGPPPFSDGNLGAALAAVYNLENLQWGHRLSAMETVVHRGKLLSLNVLQWGHRLSAMETVTT